MLKCAYCDTHCNPTREHVIPNWYGGQEKHLVFNARKPIKHQHGDIQVKDVCPKCNNEALGKLDGYAKGIYDSQLITPLYHGESIDLCVDASLFSRWLLKLCFNSARVNNADTTILSKYRRYILGLEDHPLPLIYAHVLSPTDFSVSPPAPARRDVSKPLAKEVRWFRLTQMRFSGAICDVVQRQVYIDAFCFTVLAADPDDAGHVEQLDQVIGELSQLFPVAQRLPSDGKMRLTAGDLHAGETIAWHMNNFPARYTGQSLSGCDEFAGLVTDLVNDDKKLLFIRVSKEEIDANDRVGISARLHELIATREAAAGGMQKLSVFTDAYDSDPREVWDIPEAAQFFNELFRECPFLFFLVHPQSRTLETLFMCQCKRLGEGGIVSIDADDAREFLTHGFSGLNLVTHRHGLGTETNTSITNDVLTVIATMIGPEALALPCEPET